MNAEYIAKSLEAIKVTQYGEETIPLQEFADFVRQQQAEIEALKWQIDVLKDDVAGWFDDAQGGVADDEYFTRLFERAKNEQRMSPNELSETDVMVNTIKYLSQKVRQQQAEIEALKEGIEKLKDVYCQKDSQVRQQQGEIEVLKRQCVQYEELGASWNLAKTLTDEEIEKEAREAADYWMNHFDRKSKADMEILYRHVADKFIAILRKAQEK